MQCDVLGCHRATTRVWVRVRSCSGIFDLSDEHLHPSQLWNQKSSTLHAISWTGTFQNTSTLTTTRTMLQTKGWNKILFGYRKITTLPAPFNHWYNNMAQFPIVVFSDASFRDCPDSGRSTGGYLIFMQGAVVDVSSSMPQLVAFSTCEAEYCTASLAVMAVTYVKSSTNYMASTRTTISLSRSELIQSLPSTPPTPTRKRNGLDTSNAASILFVSRSVLVRSDYSRLMAQQIARTA
jgi:hypothetical protein